MMFDQDLIKNVTVFGCTDALRHSSGSLTIQMWSIKRVSAPIIFGIDAGALALSHVGAAQLGGRFR
ncbi:hypothetical protein [Pararhodobacter oceanensis]|uniref:hypothetical protein n=1 Tax=Pararhodobacter oceanensis TaxID=2172121 RepID=UPI003A8E6177